MRLLKTWLVIVVLALAPARGHADVIDDTVRALQAEGFSTIRIGRTWLGRTRIEADGPGVTREIILNPRTGEILRDWRDRDDDDDDDRSGRGGGDRDDDDESDNSGRGGGDDDDDDDDDDDSGGGGGGDDDNDDDDDDD